MSKLFKTAHVGSALEKAGEEEKAPMASNKLLGLTKMRTEKMNPPPKISKPVIDKISFLMNLSPENACLLSQHLSSQEGIAGINYVSCRNTDKETAVKLSLPSNDPLVDPASVRIDVRHNRMSYVRFELNPSKCGKPAYEILDLWVQEYLHLENFNDFFVRCKITNLHVCVDVTGVHIEDLIFKGAWMRAYGSYYGVDDGKLETVNFGTSKNRQITVYDKKKERLKNKVVLESEVTRVECKFRMKGFNTTHLLNLENPFHRVKIYRSDFSKIDVVPEQYKTLLRDSCQARGITNALKSIKGLPRAARAKALRRLKEKCWEPWLDAQQNWSDDWAECLKAHHLYDAALGVVS